MERIAATLEGPKKLPALGENYLATRFGTPGPEVEQAQSILEPIAKTEQTLRSETSKPGHPGETMKPSPQLESIRNRLDAWHDKVEIVSGLDDSVNVTPKHYLHPETWRSINEAVRSLDGKWVSNGKQGSWRIGK